MTTKEIHRYQTRLKELFSVIDSIPEEEALIRSHWSRYLCVLVCGYLEVAVKELLVCYAQKCSNKKIADYVDAQLSRFQNPNMEKILQVVGHFDPEWQDSLRDFINADSKPKDAIDSIVGNRNQIAHGKDSGITYARIRAWYADAQKLIDELESLCG